VRGALLRAVAAFKGHHRQPSGRVTKTFLDLLIPKSDVPLQHENELILFLVLQRS